MKTLSLIKPLILDRNDLSKNAKNRLLFYINVSDFDIDDELIYASPLIIFMDGDANSLVYDRPMKILKDRHGVFSSKESLTAAWKTDSIAE